jgi:uracil-DNA glycosylase
MARPTNLDTKLEQHRRTLSACRRCHVDQGVSPIISLARRPRAMLVGQAPGKVEARGGHAFAGRAGKTLFRWFERAGLHENTARDKIYIAAITRCYPGPSPTGRGDRVPTPLERANCAEWLDAELRLIKPPLLILVGRLAIERFLPPASLEELVGREHQVAHAGGKSIAIPLPHPSGASSWVHQGNHPQLLSRALSLLGTRLAELRIVDSSARSVA